MSRITHYDAHDALTVLLEESGYEATPATSAIVGGIIDAQHRALVEIPDEVYYRVRDLRIAAAQDLARDLETEIFYGFNLRISLADAKAEDRAVLRRLVDAAKASRGGEI